jgi:hypothetical protein
MDTVHLGLNIILIGASLTLSIYCLLLVSKFLNEGIFEAPFKALFVAGLLFMVGAIFDITAEIINFPINLHWFHVSMDIVSVLIIIYGARRLYKATAKLSR